MIEVRFRAIIEQTWVLILKRGDNTVVLDKLSAHKVSGIRERIKAADGRLLYLTTYSPDSNLTEAFAKLKAILRATSHSPLGRTYRDQVIIAFFRIFGQYRD